MRCEENRDTLLRLMLVGCHLFADQSESTLRKATPNVGSRRMLQGPVASFVESTVKSTDGHNNALTYVSFDGTTRHDRFSRNPKDSAFRRRRGSRWKAHSDPADKKRGTTEGIARYEARAYAMVYRQPR